MMNREENFVSAVFYLHNDGPRALEFCRRVNAELEARFKQYELVVVNDACSDGGATMDGLRAWAAGLDAPMTILHMSLHQGLEVAMNAGLDAAIGDYVYEFDTVREEFDVSLVFAAYEAALAGNDVVSVCPRQSSGSSALFYRVFNASVHSGHRLRTDVFRLVSRRAINRVHASSAYLPYRKAAYAASGLKMTDLEYDGHSSVRSGRRLSLAFDSLAFYTDAALRVSAGITITMMVIALLELVYTIVIFCTGHPIQGWTTTMFVLTLGFSGLFAVLTIIVKYLSLLVDLIFRKKKYLIESVEKIQK